MSVTEIRDNSGSDDDVVEVDPPVMDALVEVARELQSAMAKWPAFNSAHEGYGVLMEEIRELEGHVFTNQKRRDLVAMRAEALQVAAMAIRFVVDVCNETTGRK